MSERVDAVTNELQQTAGNVRSSFGSLTRAQLNWRPAEKSWSVAQCLDHLIKTHSLYFPLFEEMASGEWIGAFALCPFLLLGEVAAASDSTVVASDLILLLIVIWCAVRHVERRDYALMDPA